MNEDILTFAAGSMVEDPSKWVEVWSKLVLSLPDFHQKISKIPDTAHVRAGSIGSNGYFFLLVNR